ncbi:tripartite tricarboxylate transporter TctB family protein [Pseudooceanicola sp.]|uniref:tripartite tricarboxylate transporter TctB family protein n=1 Tax=Pseudooceanicola sp. TaxID=1914328 RepID=UPI0035C6ECF0
MARRKLFQELFQRYRRPGDLVFAVLFFGLALFLLSQLGAQTTWARRTPWHGQPALWPGIAVVGMTVFGAFHLLGSLVSPRIEGRWTEVVFWLRSFEYVLYFLIYVALVPLGGYLPMTIVFTLFLAVRAGFRSWRPLAIAAVFGVVTALVFRGFLQVKIPAGAIYDYLPVAVRSFALQYL